MKYNLKTEEHVADTIDRSLLSEKTHQIMNNLGVSEGNVKKA